MGYTKLIHQSSYQPLPRPAAERNFKTADFLLPNSSKRDADGICRPAAFRLRRGRGGLLRLDRRTALLHHYRGKQPTTGSATEYSEWLFPDSFAGKDYSERPTSIGDAESTLSHGDLATAVVASEAEKDKEAEGDEDDAMEVDTAATTDVADEGTGPVETTEVTASPAPAGDKVDDI